MPAATPSSKRPDAPAVLVFGATGFTGRMVVADLVERGVPLRIAGRSRERLEQLAARHPDAAIEIAVADVEDPPSLDRAANGARVLVSTVGPYSWWGRVAVEAALNAKLHYIDISGEPAWVRTVFEEYGPPASSAGVALLPSIGYDYVPGNLAGALALEAAGERATRVDVGYFMTGEASRSLKTFSAGTLRSLRASSSARQFGFRGGRIVEERAAKRVLTFDFAGRERTAISIGATEHYSLPALHPELREVNVGLGWFGSASRVVKLFAAAGEVAEKLPGYGRVAELFSGGGRQVTKGRGEPAGPAADARARARTLVIAEARDSGGAILARVTLDGPGPYDLTGKLVGWAAQRAAGDAFAVRGASGPVEAFGLEELRATCETIGLIEA